VTPEPLSIVTPGTHVAVLADRADVGVEGRILGLELRDTLLVLRPGPTSGFVFLFRTPMLEDTVAEQVLKTSTGALNLDACRVAADLSEFFSANGKPRSGMGHANGYGMGDGYGGDRANPPNEAGRWPPNLLLVHAPECLRAGTRRVHTGVAHRSRSGGRSFGGDRFKPPMHDMTYAEADGLETASAYVCEEGCPVKILDDLSGVLHSAIGKPSQQKTVQANVNFNGKAFSTPGVNQWGDSGGASRFFPQFESESGLLDWLRRLMGGGAIFRDTAL
jgi:hypothetical protein